MSSVTPTVSLAPAAHPDRATVASFANDVGRTGFLALAACVLLAGLNRSVLAGTAWEARVASAQTALEGLALALLAMSVVLTVAIGAGRRNLALIGGVVLAAAALVAAYVKAGGWNETTSATLILLLAVAVASSAVARPLGVVRIALRAAVCSSLLLIAVNPDAASSPLTTRYFLDDLPFRFRGVLNHPVALSSAAALLFVIAVCVRYRSSLRVLDACAALAAVALSDTRSGAIAIGLAVAGRLLLTRLDPAGPQFRFIAIAVPTGLVAAQIGVTAWVAGRIDSLLEVTSERSLIWDWCWDAFLRQPGLGSDPEVLAGGRYPQVDWWHCHDQVLSTGYHLGVVGLLGLAILLAGMLAITLARARTGAIHPWLALCVVLALGIFETPLSFLGDAQSTFLALAVVLLVVADPAEDSSRTRSDLESLRPTFVPSPVPKAER